MNSPLQKRGNAKRCLNRIKGHVNAYRDRTPDVGIETSVLVGVRLTLQPIPAVFYTNATRQ